MEITKEPRPSLDAEKYTGCTVISRPLKPPPVFSPKGIRLLGLSLPVAVIVTISPPVTWKYTMKADTFNAVALDAVSDQTSAALAETDGRFVAKPLLWGSDRISSLVQANGYLTLGAWQSLKPGSEVTVELLGTREFSRIPGGNTR